MTMDRMRLNMRIKGEIRHRSVANRLQNFQSAANPFAFESDKNPRIGSDWIYRSTNFLCTPTYMYNFSL